MIEINICLYIYINIAKLIWKVILIKESYINSFQLNLKFLIYYYM